MKKYIKVVGAVIVNENDEILCAQRPEGKSLELMWEFPGGKIEEGEAPLDALRRELEEEMNCQIEVGDKIITTVHEYDFGIVELTTYYSKVISGDIQLLEHVDMKWLKREVIDTLEWAPADIPAIELIKKG
ncbi:(deoxy)nucleoside triphosphate pyrophosphohydrolase [Salinicoccus halodurans]|uniref:8-oxo-dGTP diphosphatase n=1 Tax=Salinicoccus halodurans TaxID=407035 RepID=A0A0F7D4N7_9STAP|nr:(deoxy)nucleoside triphosphate pyrophosphohydrolase [Salinicoccus halodurans]AKG74555.1 DNA mismatch repair protein MutT [Salinicoccus halodurans]SFK89833.1 8-oxo-dGTP diphosphatase [Salinicoccus halodurans]